MGARNFKRWRNFKILIKTLDIKNQLHYNSAINFDADIAQLARAADL